MSRIYHTSFTRSGRLLRERASMGGAHTGMASTPIQIQGDAAGGNGERRLLGGAAETELAVAIP